MTEFYQLYFFSETKKQVADQIADQIAEFLFGTIRLEKDGVLQTGIVLKPKMVFAVFY